MCVCVGLNGQNCEHCSIVSQLWGAWLSLTVHIKIFRKRKREGEGIVTRYYRGGRRPKHQGQAPHTGGDLPSYLTPLTQEIAEYVRATGPCVGSALNTPPAAGP